MPVFAKECRKKAYARLKVQLRSEMISSQEIMGEPAVRTIINDNNTEIRRYRDGFKPYKKG